MEITGRVDVQYHCPILMYYQTPIAETATMTTVTRVMPARHVPLVTRDLSAKVVSGGYDLIRERTRHCGRIDVERKNPMDCIMFSGVIIIVIFSGYITIYILKEISHSLVLWGVLSI